MAEDKDIFDAAMAEAPVEEKVVETPKDENRDPETGRFVPKEAVEEKPQAEAPVEPKAEEPKPKPDDQPPSWRLREEAEARRAAEQRAEAAERRFEEAQRELHRRLAQIKPAEERKPIDILEDPDGYAREVRQDVFAEMQAKFNRASVRRAERAYGEEWKKAWTAFDTSGDRLLLARVQASDDVGEEIMSWFREHEAIREIGGDLKGYRQKVFDEAMKDPDFRKKAMETWRSEAENGNGQRPNTVTQLPSLNRAPGGSTHASDKEPETDAELFRSVVGRRA